MSDRCKRVGNSLSSPQFRSDPAVCFEGSLQHRHALRLEIGDALWFERERFGYVVARLQHQLMTSEIEPEFE